MVDALHESQRVLLPSGVLIDVRPVIAPIGLEVATAGQAVWAKEVHSYSAPEDVAAADAAVKHAVSRGRLVCESILPFDFDIWCDSADELRGYIETRKLRGEEIPYEELEVRRRELGAEGHEARLRCRRPWMLSTYRKR